MAPIPGTPHEPTYAAAAHVVDQALGAPGSLFSPGRSIWRPQVLADLRSRHTGATDMLGDGFQARWARRLDGAPAEIVQLAAEIFYVHLLFATDLSVRTKRRLITETLAWSPNPPAVPAALDVALDGGIARTSMAFKLRRMSQLGLLIEVGHRWWQLDAHARATALDDPWTFKAWLHSVPHEGAQAQREALLHLVHPETFEPIISAKVKQRIVHALSRHVPAGVDDVDAALAGIRAALERRHGHGFQFIDPAIAPLWRPE
jgi:5-methylcytosine-specific restriction enzyme B